MGYSKEFLIDCFLWRYEMAGLGTRSLALLVEKCWDDYGKDKFRDYCSLDAAEIKKYSLWLVDCGYSPKY